MYDRLTSLTDITGMSRIKFIRCMPTVLSPNENKGILETDGPIVMSAPKTLMPPSTPKSVLNPVASKRAIDKLFNSMPDEYKDYLLKSAKDGTFKSSTKSSLDWRSAETLTNYVYLNVLYTNEVGYRFSDVIFLDENNNPTLQSVAFFKDAVIPTTANVISFEVPVPDNAVRAICVYHSVTTSNGKPCGVWWRLLRRK